MSDLDKEYVAALEAEIEALRDRINVLEDQLGLTLEVPLSFGLSVNEAQMVGLLYKRDFCTKQMFMSLLYGHRPDADEPAEKIVDVYICKARAKLKEFDLPIETAWGKGYFMKPETKARFATFLKQPVSDGKAA